MARERSTPVPGGSVVPLRRVLAVDDDDALRLVLGRALARLGYEVLLAATPAEALGLLEAGSVVHAIVSDVEMPGMTGVEMAARVISRFPHVAILFITGSGQVPPLVQCNPLVGLVAKPFVISELSARLAQLIDWAPVEAGAGPPATDEVRRPSPLRRRVDSDG